MKHTPADGHPSAARLLGAEHARIDALYRKMIVAAERGIDHRRLRLAWSRLERMLRAHLRAEERWLFLELLAAHPAEINAFKVAHGHIRDMLGTIETVSDLRSLRDEKVVELIDFVREHARRKQETLYRWATGEIPPPTLSAMLRVTTGSTERPQVGDLGAVELEAPAADAASPPA